jgi:hypothetical protein
VNPVNAGNERVWDWNNIDAEGANGIHEFAVVEPIVNMQGNEETPVPSMEHLYERADEELDDDANTEVFFEEGAEEDIAHSHNGASNGLAEGTASGSTACSNTNAASTSNGGNGPRTVVETEPIESIPNQGIQDNPPPPNMNVNSQVSHVVVPTVNNTSREENVPVNEMHTEDVQGSMPSIGTTLVALGRTTLGTSNRPPKHLGPIVQCSVPRTFGNRNSNDGPRDTSRDPRTGQQSKNGSQGRKCLLDAREVRPFYTEGTRGGSSRTPTSTVVRGPDVDENNDNSTTRHVKRFVKTKVAGTVQIGLRNLSSEVEGEVPMNFGYEEQSLGDDEMTDKVEVAKVACYPIWPAIISPLTNSLCTQNCHYCYCWAYLVLHMAGCKWLDSCPFKVCFLSIQTMTLLAIIGDLQ